MRFESSTVIGAPVQKVWGLVDRLEEWPEWMPSIKKIERLDSAGLAAGSRLNVTVKVLFFSVRLPMTIVEFVPLHSAVLEGRFLFHTLSRFYRFEEMGTSTRVSVGGNLTGLLSLFGRRSGQRISREIVLAAKQRVESGRDSNTGAAAGLT